jgi:hypothetical protein
MLGLRRQQSQEHISDHQRLVLPPHFLPMCMTGQTVRSQDVRFPTITLPRTNDRYVPILSVCRSEVCAVKSDEFLAERVTVPSGMMPPTKTRFEMLLGGKEHEMHHRGQLMLIERMLGIVPHLTRQMQERMAMASTVPAP